MAITLVAGVTSLIIVTVGVVEKRGRTTLYKVFQVKEWRLVLTSGLAFIRNRPDTDLDN